MKNQYDKLKRIASNAILNSEVRHAAQRKFKITKNDKYTDICKNCSNIKKLNLEKLVNIKNKNVKVSVGNDINKRSKEEEKSISADFTLDRDTKMSLHFPKNKSNVLDNSKRNERTTEITPKENDRFYKNVNNTDLQSDALQKLKVEEIRKNIVEKIKSDELKLVLYENNFEPSDENVEILKEGLITGEILIIPEEE